MLTVKLALRMAKQTSRRVLNKEKKTECRSKWS